MAADANATAATAKTAAGVDWVRMAAATRGPTRMPAPSTTPTAPFAAVSSSGVRDSDGSSADWVGRVTTSELAATAALRYTRTTGSSASIAAAVASMAEACTTYPTASTRWRGNRSPRPAAAGATRAAGTSWSSATTPTDAGPVRS